MFQAVGGGAEVAAAPRDEFPETTAWWIPSGRRARACETPSGGHGWTPPADLHADLLARPMRLGDQVPHSSRPRLNSSSSGA